MLSGTRWAMVRQFASEAERRTSVYPTPGQVIPGWRYDPHAAVCGAGVEKRLTGSITGGSMTTGRHTLRDGVVVGLIGYAAVALFYSAFDFLAARGPLYTVNMLGRAIFRGLRDPSVLLFPVQIDRGAVFAYNALHLGIALVIGFVVAWLVAVAEENPARRQVVRFILVAGYIATVLAVGALTTPMRAVLPWWSIMVANAAAAAAAGAYLIVRHPGLWRRLALRTA